MFLLVTQSKGGVGKSTLAAQLAILARDLGYSVAVIDADKQAHAAKTVHRAEPSIQVSIVTNVDEASAAATALERDFDLVVMDTPGHDHTPEVTSALTMFADVALVPCGPSDGDVAELKNAYQFIALSQKIKGKPEATIVWCKTADNDVFARTTTPRLEEKGLRVASNRLPQVKAIQGSALKYAVHRLTTPELRHAAALEAKLGRVTADQVTRATEALRALFEELVRPHLERGSDHRQTDDVPQETMEQVANV